MTFTPAAPWRASVRPVNGKPTLCINDQPVVPTFYSLTDCPGGRWTWEEFPKRNIEHFTRQGITLFQVDIFFEMLFTEEDAFDLELMRRQIRGVLDVCSEAAVVIRLHVNPSRAWELAHPEECTAYDDVEATDTRGWGLHRLIDYEEQHPLRHSLVSKPWRDEAAKRLRRFCAALADTPEGGRVIGIHIADGIFGEWHYWGFNSYCADVGKAMTQHFRDWLRARYGTDDALQSAWNNPSVTFQTAMVPGLNERKALDDGIFHDPLRARNLADYYACQHEAVADNIIQFCRIVKEAWPRPVTTGVFYGYFFSCFGRQAAGGHLCADRVLRSPYVDYLSAPMSYMHGRNTGEAACSRGLQGAARLHNKLWLDEMDQVTRTGSLADGQKGFTPAQDRAHMVRNIARPYTAGGGSWYYDFGPLENTGWWDLPDMLPMVGKLKTIFDRYSELPYTKPADVLAVYDMESFYYTGQDWIADCISHTAVDELEEDLYHSGAIFDDIYLSDLDKVDLSRYRVVIIANAFHLSEERLRFIREKVAQNGRHIIWNYMPGIIDEQQLRPERVSEVVGMALTRENFDKPPRLVVDKPGWATGQYEVWNPVPIYHVTDPEAEAFGTLNETEKVGLACRRFDTHVSWFASIPLRNPAIQRAIFREAGCHIIDADNDVHYMGGGLFVVHTKEGGPRRFVLPNGPVIETQLPPICTQVYDSQTGELLLTSRLPGD